MTRQEEKDEYYGQAMVTTSYGYMLIATTRDICIPGLSCGARGVALLARGLGHAPDAEEIAKLTGDEVWQVAQWIEELEGTGYLEEEED